MDKSFQFLWIEIINSTEKNILIGVAYPHPVQNNIKGYVRYFKKR